jgi:hypothetical protein
MIKTLLTGLAFVWLFTNYTFSQAVNNNASWANTSWTVGGNYVNGALLNNPRTSGYFTFDDDAAGDGSVDKVWAASPIINLTPAKTAGENVVQVSGKYIFSSDATVGDQLTIQWYNADNSTWNNFYSFIFGAPTLNWRDCSLLTAIDYTSDNLNISDFTPTQLAGFRYRFYYDDYDSWAYGFCLNSPNISSAITCNIPTALSVANITNTAADLGWTENGNATLWDIEIVPSGNPRTGTPTAAVSNPYSATGLTAGTTYDFYIRSNCGTGGSIWAGPFTFTTTGGTVCTAPSALGVANVSSTQADLSWTENGTATAWDIEVVSGGATPAGIPSDVGVSANPFTKTGLSASTSYDFYVRADCGPNSSTWVGPFNFTTATPCSPPSALAAANITSSTADLSWTENGNATTWDLEIIAGGSSPSGTATNVGVTTNPFNATGLTASTSYDFFVRADCGTGSSAWVGPFNFTTGTACSDPSTLAASNITSSSADLSWTENGIANAWDIEIIAGGTSPTGTPSNTGVTSNPYNATGLTGSTSYDFYVRADCGSGTSAWVGPFNFTTTASCPSPSNLSAANMTNTTVDLAWMENGSASIWDIEIVANGATPSGTPTEALVSSNPYTATGLTSNSSYDFYVRSVCGVGDESMWDGPFTFQTTNTSCAAPSDLDVNNVTSNSADLSWVENGTATLWDLEIVLTGTTPTGTPSNVGVTPNPYTATGLLPATGYDFYVRADCGAMTSNWSGPLSFTTSQATTCADPSNLGAANIGDLEAELTWTENGSAAEWDVEILLSGSTPSGTATSTSVANPHLQTGLTPGTAYDFYVRANCGATLSEWVGPFTFNSTAGINTNSSINNVRVFPNPSNGLFILELMDQKAQIESAEIFDMNGRKVLSIHDFKMKTIIDLSDKNEGVYTMKIVSASGLSTHRLIIQ